MQEEIVRLMFCRKGLQQSIGLLIFNLRGWKQEIAGLQEKIGGPQERIQRAQENLRPPIFRDGTWMKGIRRMRLC
uniref:hypothetical protein n=1 Tax=Candidatus Electronema sp. TaxID=2698783 RepID=UPI00405759CE